MSGRYRIAALDIGGTKIKACLFEGEVPTQTVEGDTLARKGGAPAVLERAAALLRPLLPFDFIGVSTAGQVDPGTGVIRYANENLPGYTGMDVKGFFEARFHVPAVILNDVCAAALGEGAYGAACTSFPLGCGYTHKVSYQKGGQYETRQ